ncbi:hypothetical protein C8Q78DRAFT_1078804 [Trametes maxima]|nr:hypothetical protein C8Q78DRAFT_1078804 [Trametes maxima]
MATYYVPRRPQSVSRPTSSRGADDNGHAGAERTEPPDVISADHSIYIFPNPPSEPPSPGGSMSSAPTDFDFSCPSESHSPSRSRATLRRPDSTPADRRNSRSSVISAASDCDSLPTPSQDDLEIDVELWDAFSDRATELSESEESWALEGEVERAVIAELESQYDPPVGSIRRFPLPPLDIPSTAGARYRVSFRPRRRSRTRSRARTTSVSSVALSSAQVSAPHPRMHIPLLSFFASLLSVELDDPALRLLTNADTGDSEAVLFPGHSSARLLTFGEEDAERWQPYKSDPNLDTDILGTTERSPVHEDAEEHGLSRLLLATISDQSTVALRSLRQGLAVGIPAATGPIMSFPRASELFGLWRVVEQVYSRSSQAWKEVWSVGSPQGSTVMQQ